MAFDPATLFANGEVGAWYDPSDISTLFQDAAGTIPVTADGQQVGKILDKSGNGNHATQSVSSKRPTFRDVDGVRYLEFDQIDDKIIIPYQLSEVNTLGISYLPDVAQTSFLLVDSQQNNPWGISGAEGNSSISINNTDNTANNLGFNAIRWDSIGSTISDLKRNDLYNSYASSRVVLADLSFANWPSVFSYGKYSTSSLSGFTKTTGYIMVEGSLNEQTSLGLEGYLTALTVPPLLPSKLLNSNNLSTTNINAIYSLSLDSIACSNIIDEAQLLEKSALEIADLNSQNKLSTTSILTNYSLSLDGISNSNLLDQTLLSIFYSVTVDKISSGQRVETATIPVSLFLDSIFQASSTTNSLLRYIPKIGNYKISFSKTLSPNILNVGITKIEYGE